MNEGAGCCHLPAPTRSLPHQQELGFFQTCHESLWACRRVPRGSLELLDPHGLCPVSIHCILLTPLTSSGSLCWVRTGVTGCHWGGPCPHPAQMIRAHRRAARPAAIINPMEASVPSPGRCSGTSSRSRKMRALFLVPGRGWCLSPLARRLPAWHRFASLCWEQTNNICPLWCSPAEPFPARAPQHPHPWDYPCPMVLVCRRTAVVGAAPRWLRNTNKLCRLGTQAGASSVLTLNSYWCDSLAIYLFKATELFAMVLKSKPGVWAGELFCLSAPRPDTDDNLSE